MLTIATILFDGFETLDAFGPIEVLGNFPDQMTVGFYSAEGGIVYSTQKVPVVTGAFGDLPAEDYALLIPGGMGTRPLIRDKNFIDRLSKLTAGAKYILTVCTGSALLSKTGILDGRKATSNKRAFSWVTGESPAVNWVKKARWVRDGNIYTSSGVSAGIDLAFGFIADLLGHDAAVEESTKIEYEWNDDPAHDPFAELY